ncbi:MAG TPA: hypothetical protein VGO52_20925 [Hyphomonadaceae bacterium]|nr:hypothetical protein [Hyphomonadaceae bacterium]
MAAVLVWIILLLTALALGLLGLVIPTAVDLSPTFLLTIISAVFLIGLVVLIVATFILLVWIRLHPKRYRAREGPNLAKTERFAATVLAALVGTFALVSLIDLGAARGSLFGSLIPTAEAETSTKTDTGTVSGKKPNVPDPYRSQPLALTEASLRDCFAKSLAIDSDDENFWVSEISKCGQRTDANEPEVLKYMYDRALKKIASAGRIQLAPPLTAEITCPAADLVGFPPRERKNNRSRLQEFRPPPGYRFVNEGAITPIIRTTSNINGGHDSPVFKDGMRAMDVALRCRGEGLGQGRTWHHIELTATIEPDPTRADRQATMLRAAAELFAK